MVSADSELLNVINAAAAAYLNNPPAYITYQEFTHASAPSLGRSQNINRAVAVRQADDFAVMQDLPQGARRTGQAFPIIPYFDPFSQFSYSWFANLKNVNITIQRGAVTPWGTPPPDTSGATMYVPYFSFWDPSYVQDADASRIDLRVLPTPALQNGQLYPYDVVEDAQTHLPVHLEIRFAGIPDTLTMDYQVLQGHWVITHATYTTPQHVGPLSFTVISDTTYQNLAFPATPPDPLLAGTPAPTPTP